MLAIALPCACAISATACYALFADDLGRLEPPPWQAIVPPSAFVLFFAGPLCEETGWRGYLQPHLLKVFAPFRAALIIGVIWCFWHIPLSLTPGTMPVLDSPTTWFQYLVSTIAVSIIIMLIVLRGHGSIAVAMLFHWASNAALSQVVAPMYPAASDQACDNVELIQTGLLLIVASTIMLRSGDIFNQHSVSN